MTLLTADCPLEEHCHFHDIVGLDDYDIIQSLGNWYMVAYHQVSEEPEEVRSRMFTSLSFKHLYTGGDHVDFVVNGRHTYVLCTCISASVLYAFMYIMHWYVILAYIYFV